MINLINDFFSQSKIANNNDSRAIMQFLTSAESINRMIVATEFGLPALTGVVKELEERFGNCNGFPLNCNAPNKNSTNRQNVGRMIKYIMKKFGYIPVERGLGEKSRLLKFSGAKYFYSGAIYEKILKPEKRIDIKIKNVYKMNDKEIIAAKKVLEMVGIEATDENIAHYESCNYLTINKGNDKKDYCWYFDADNNEACVCVDTLEKVDAESVGLF